MALFDPMSLRGLALANRIVVSPMCQYSSREGIAADWHLAHWAQLAQSGAGLVVVEATAVTRDGRITPGCLGLWDEDRERCRQANIPDDVRYRPKWRIALDQLCRLRDNGMSFDWLTFDEGYGAAVPF